MAIREDTDVPALCVEVLKPLCAAKYSHDLGLKYGCIPHQEQNRSLSVPESVITRSRPILGSRSISEADIAMPWQAVPMLQHSSQEGMVTVQFLPKWKRCGMKSVFIPNKDSSRRGCKGAKGILPRAFPGTPWVWCAWSPLPPSAPDLSIFPNF